MHSKAAACRPTCLAALSPIAQARCACCEGCSSLAAGWRCSTCSRSRGQTSEQWLREGEGQGQAGEGQASLQQAVPSPTCRFATAAATLTAENPPLSGLINYNAHGPFLLRPTCSCCCRFHKPDHGGSVQHVGGFAPEEMTQLLQGAVRSAACSIPRSLRCPPPDPPALPRLPAQ